MVLVRSLIEIFVILSAPASFAADYIGSSSCKGCHQQQFNDWQGSHHERAMAHATEDNVKGDFNNARIEFKGQQNRFFKKQNEFWVNIAGADGKFQDYQVKYTFGYEPLQQYMVEFSDGRVQLIPFAWDTRTASEGGSDGFTYTLSTVKVISNFSGQTPGRIGITCAQIVTRPMSRKISM